MVITRISPPKFKVGRFSLNEYELRNLMLEVAKEVKPSGIKVKDILGVIAYIEPTGYLSVNLEGFGISSKLTLQLIGINRELKKSFV